MAPRILYQNLQKSIEFTCAEISQHLNIISEQKTLKTKGVIEVKTILPKDKEAFRNAITEKLVDLKEPHCIWAFNDMNSAAKKLTLRYYCAISTCKRQYRIEFDAKSIINGETTNGTILYTGDLIHTAEKKKTMPIRGKTRAKLGKKLLKRAAINFRDEQYETVSEEREIEGNSGYRMTKNATRRLKSEAMKLSDENRDDWEDIVQIAEKQTKNDSFITNLSRIPFSVIYVEPRSQEILIELKKLNGETVAFLDATGRLARKPFANCKPLLFHGLVVYLPNVEANTDAGDFGILGGMLTERQTQTQIAVLLNNIKMRNLDIHPLVNHVVSDNSRANFNAILAVLNNQTITKYLDYMWQIWEGAENNPDLTLLHLCIVHLLRQWKEDLRKTFDNDSVKINLMKIFCKLALVRTFAAYEKIIFDLFVLLMCKDENSDEFIAANSTMTELCEGNFDKMLGSEEDKPDQEEIDENEENELKRDENDNESLFKQSRFYQHGKNLLDSVTLEQLEEDCTEVTNPYHAPQLANDFLVKYLSIAPLFVNINAPKELKPDFFYSNNIIESFNGRFKIYLDNLKHEIGQRPVKVGKFCNKLKFYNTCRAREFLVNRKRQKLIKKTTEETEQWKKSAKTSPKRKFFVNSSLLSVKPNSKKGQPKSQRKLKQQGKKKSAAKGTSLNNKPEQEQQQELQTEEQHQNGNKILKFKAQIVETDNKFSVRSIGLDMSSLTKKQKEEVDNCIKLELWSLKERGETGLVEFELEIPEDEQELEQLLAEENDKIQMFRAAANSTINDSKNNELNDTMSTANSSAMSVSTIQSNDSEPIYLRDVREVKLPDHVEYEIPEDSLDAEDWNQELMDNEEVVNLIQGLIQKYLHDTNFESAEYDPEFITQSRKVPAELNENLLFDVENRFLVELEYGNEILSTLGIKNPSTSKNATQINEKPVKTDKLLFEIIWPELIIYLYSRKFNLDREGAIKSICQVYKNNID